MNPDTLLTQLRDIHAPEAVTWWPPAIGWWILLVFILVLSVIAIRSAIAWHRKNAWRRQAFQELNQLEAEYLSRPSATTVSNTSSLLKRCLATQTGDRTILSYSGEKWLSALSMHSSSLTKSDLEALTVGHFQPSPLPLDKDAFKRFRAWIKGLKA